MVAPLLKQQLADQPAADAVMWGLDAGPLLWQEQPEGWLLATRPQSPAQGCGGCSVCRSRA